MSKFTTVLCAMLFGAAANAYNLLERHQLIDNLKKNENLKWKLITETEKNKNKTHETIRIQREKDDLELLYKVDNFSQFVLYQCQEQLKIAENAAFAETDGLNQYIINNVLGDITSHNELIRETLDSTDWMSNPKLPFDAVDRAKYENLEAEFNSRLENAQILGLSFFKKDAVYCMG